jgi:2'-5' RNA ligase
MNDRTIVTAELAKHQKDVLYEWVKGLQWPEASKLQRSSSYHVTAMFSPVGKSNDVAQRWLSQYLDKQSFSAIAHSLEIFDKAEDDTYSPIVLRVHAKELTVVANEILEKAACMGFEPSIFEHGFQPHITIGFAEQLPLGDLPSMKFELSPLKVFESQKN